MDKLSSLIINNRNNLLLTITIIIILLISFGLKATLNKATSSNMPSKVLPSGLFPSRTGKSVCEPGPGPATCFDISFPSLFH